MVDGEWVKIADRLPPIATAVAVILDPEHEFFKDPVFDELILYDYAEFALTAWLGSRIWAYPVDVVVEWLDVSCETKGVEE